MAKVTLYKVKKAVKGADRFANLYFRTKKEADDFCKSSEYVDKPVKVSIDEENVAQVLMSTEYDM